ncbi:hypothetical protein BDZ88DRAFT_118725 [Geranomyces variabilis]|nr:hypothetical protein BDZ88DRAFT_118725 [Geranomyces variabilis]
MRDHSGCPAEEMSKLFVLGSQGHVRVRVGNGRSAGIYLFGQLKKARLPSTVKSASTAVDPIYSNLRMEKTLDMIKRYCGWTVSNQIAAWRSTTRRQTISAADDAYALTPAREAVFQAGRKSKDACLRLNLALVLGVSLAGLVYVQPVNKEMDSVPRGVELGKSGSHAARESLFHCSLAACSL